MGCKNYGQATLVHVKIATEVIENLTPGATGSTHVGVTYINYIKV